MDQLPVIKSSIDKQYQEVMNYLTKISYQAEIIHTTQPQSSQQQKIIELNEKSLSKIELLMTQIDEQKYEKTNNLDKVVDIFLKRAYEIEELMENIINDIDDCVFDWQEKFNQDLIKMQQYMTQNSQMINENIYKLHELNEKISSTENIISNNKVDDENNNYHAEDIDIMLRSKKGINLYQKIIDVKDGNLYYQDRQVAVFIAKHQHIGLDDNDGNRCHLTDCHHFKRKQQELFKDCYATKSTNDVITIFGEGGKTHIKEHRIKPCKVCLQMLNYKDYNEVRYQQEKDSIYENFSLVEFFDEKFTQTNNTERPLSRSWHCQQCQVDLTNHKTLLHTYKPNRFDDERQLCVMCYWQHKKDPELKPDDITQQIITQLRKNISN